MLRWLELYEVMFWEQASVILFIGVFVQGVCDERVSAKGSLGWPLESEKRAVRILLECFLVKIITTENLIKEINFP